MAIFGTIVDTVSDVIDDATDIITDVAEAAVEVLPTVIDTAADVIDTGLDIAADVIDTGLDIATDVVSAGTEIAVNAAGALIDTAVDVVEIGVGVAAGTVNALVDTATDIVGTGLGIAENVVDAAGNVLSAVGDFIFGDDDEEDNDGIVSDIKGVIQGIVNGDMNAATIAATNASMTAGGFSDNPTPMYYLPGYGVQINQGDEQSGGVFSSSPLLWSYSPRLFGAPPQLSHYCDMRLKGSKDGDTPGPVGDFYLNDILLDAQVANIIVGKAIFTGGTSNLANTIRVAGQYVYAMSKYGLLGEKDTSVNDRSTAGALSKTRNMDAYKRAVEDGGDTSFATTVAQGLADIADGTTIAVLDGEATNMINELSGLVKGGAAVAAPLLTSLSVQQPFYSFDADWNTHMNNVKMMINTAVIMLGLQKASVRIGDYLWPIGMHAKFHDESDVWSNYRFITATEGLGTANQIDQMNGNSTQYVSFMIDQFSMTESYVNTVGESQLYQSISKGNEYGNEISFLASVNTSKLDDAVIDMASSAREQAEEVLTKLSKGNGRFTAALAGAMARSYVGDHTIYPDVFTGHRANESGCSFTVHLNASSGDPYSYLIEVLVPLFHLMAMGIPKLSQNNASAYTYPPMVQVNIPGIWGCRMGMVTQIQVQKNPNQRDYSVHGFPLSVNVTVNITDLEHVLMTSPMDKPAVFLNNTTMFDYIAQCAGVDKYRVNGSVRLVTRMALAVSAVNNSFNNLGDAVMSDITGFINKLTGISRM